MSFLFTFFVIIITTLRGLGNVFHPCRFETFAISNRDLANGQTLAIILDGAHNEDGLYKLFQSVKQRQDISL